MVLLYALTLIAPNAFVISEPVQRGVGAVRNPAKREEPVLLRSAGLKPGKQEIEHFQVEKVLLGKSKRGIFIPG